VQRRCGICLLDNKLMSKRRRGICPRRHRLQCNITATLIPCKPFVAFVHKAAYDVHSAMESVAFSHGTTNICCAFLNAKRGICPRDYKYMLCIPQCKAWHLPTGLQIYVVHSSMQSVAFAHRTTNYVVHSSMQSVALSHGTRSACCAFLNATRGIFPRD